MFDTHEVHWYERDYVTRVKNYLHDHFGKTFDDIVLSVDDVVNAMHEGLHPSEYIEQNKKQWGIHRLQSSIPGTAARIVAV